MTQKVTISLFFTYSVLSSFLLAMAAHAEEEAPASEIEASTLQPRWSADYFAIFYGPSLGSPSSLQPTSSGELDPSRPLVVKNYLTLGYSPTPEMAISAVTYWQWRPVNGHDIMMKDPYLAISHNKLLNSGPLNLYADLRIHFPVSSPSREANLLTSLQSFQMLTYPVGSSHLTLGAFSSIRYNLYGPLGFGNDLELYFGRNLNYQISSTLAFTLLYEMGASHIFGAPPSQLYSDGTDLEPGISWVIAPGLVINPYLNLFTGDRVNFHSTAFGMTLSWDLF